MSPFPRTINSFSTLFHNERTLDVAAGNASQRLAQVMASQPANHGDDEDDLGFRFGLPPPSFARPVNSTNGFNSDNKSSVPSHNNIRCASPADAENQMEASALRNKLDMLQEDNESLIDKLRIAEEGCEEAEARVRELEKQVASLGEGVSLEIQINKQAALRDAKQKKDVSDEEINSLKSKVKEEMVLKRSWLARH